MGFINNLRTWLWIPVAQDAARRMSLIVFDHMLALDLGFHLRKKTGEVTKVVDRGTNAIQNILSTVLFNILPQVRVAVWVCICAWYAGAELAGLHASSHTQYVQQTPAVTDYVLAYRFVKTS